MTTDPFTHMTEAWSCSQNPFPQDGIRSEMSDQPISSRVLEAEYREMATKFIRGGLSGNLRMGYLWSQGPRGEDTGFGKTTLEQRIVSDISHDFGATVLRETGLAAPLPKIAAAYASLQNLGGIGLFPVFFEAAARLATPSQDGARPVLDRARDLISKKIGADDANAIRREIVKTRMTIAPTGTPLREELLTALLRGDLELGVEMQGVKEATRTRSGIQYLDFAVTVLAAANVKRVYVMVDQLEDIVGNRNIPAAKRSREVARIRDLLEKAPFAQHVRFTLTFHHTAADALKDFWVQNRLPPFEVGPANQAALVVLRGLQNVDQVTDLLRVYLDTVRDDRRDDIVPFQYAVAPVLLEASGGRVGKVLQQAHELFNAAAVKNLPAIDGEFASRFLAGKIDARGHDAAGAEPVRPADEVADLLLG